jgi:uncharacterized BrkB/YihY/UPF0761 family membrane protein
VTKSIIQMCGAIIISVLICLTFLFVFYEAYSNADQHNLDLLVGALIAQFSFVVQFWVGSSMSSLRKDQMLLDATPPPQDDTRMPPPPKAV